MQVLLETDSIPASRALSVRNAREPALLWVYSGTASIETTTRTHRLTAAQGLWMPAGIPYTLQVDADSVAFPIFPAVGSKAPPLHHPLRVGLPASWSDWLMYQFARSIGYLRGRPPTPACSTW